MGVAVARAPFLKFEEITTENAFLILLNPAKDGFLMILKILEFFNSISKICQQIVRRKMECASSVK